MLWSDPIDFKEADAKECFTENKVRKCSFFYGEAAVARFLEDNKLLSIIRAHEAQPEGFKLHEWTAQSAQGGSGIIPPVMTIFSAPNYCDMYKNKAAIIILSEGVMSIQQFSHSPHPFILPRYMDLIGWSLPFVTEKGGSE